jgi:hypothetical protein
MNLCHQKFEACHSSVANRSAHNRQSPSPRRRRRMGDVLQSSLPALDAGELRSNRRGGRYPISRHREGPPLRLLGVRVAARRCIAGLARAWGGGNGAITPKEKPGPAGGLAGQSQEREVCPSHDLMSSRRRRVSSAPKRKMARRTSGRASSWRLVAQPFAYSKNERGDSRTPVFLRKALGDPDLRSPSAIMKLAQAEARDICRRGRALHSRRLTFAGRISSNRRPRGDLITARALLSPVAPTLR